jgi:glycerophosphoryl diester phosphodiesterase
MRLDGRIVLCHSPAELVPESPELDDALELVAELGLGLQLDVKGHGHEAAIADAVNRHGLLDDALASSFSRASLVALAQAEPRLRRAFTYPEDRHGLSDRRLTAPLVGPALALMRATLPARLLRILRRVDASAATLHHGVVSPAAIARCHAARIAVWVWTVNEPELARRLESLGADAIIGDDPRILRDLSTASEHR